MKGRMLEVMRRGTEAGLVAGIPQVLLPKLEERYLLQAGENADIGPRLIEAAADKVKQPLPEDRKWLGAASFHVAYAAFWGTVYGLAYERRPAKPVTGGLALAYSSASSPSRVGAWRYSRAPRQRRRNVPGGSS